jgi:hypothetical protein
VQLRSGPASRATALSPGQGCGRAPSRGVPGGLFLRAESAAESRYASLVNPQAPDPASAGPPADGVLDLLGLLAYASLTAFFRISDDAALALSLPDKTALAELAVAEFGHYRLLRDRIEQLDADPTEVMQPYVGPIDAFHARTAPSDWLEGLVKAYVGDEIAADFYRAVAQVLDPANQQLVRTVLADTGKTDFIVVRVRQAIEADPRVAGRLGLWARRLVGEALGQAQRVAADREPLARLLVGHDASQLGDISRMFAGLADAHAARMAALGLAD